MTFFQNFLAAQGIASKKLLILFKKNDLYMNLSTFYTKHTYNSILLFHCETVCTTIFNNVAKRIPTFQSPPPFSYPVHRPVFITFKVKINIKV